MQEPIRNVYNVRAGAREAWLKSCPRCIFGALSGDVPRPQELEASEIICLFIVLKHAQQQRTPFRGCFPCLKRRLQLSLGEISTSPPWANQPQPCRRQGPQAASQQQPGHTAVHGEPLHSLAAAQQAANQPQCCQQPQQAAALVPRPNTRGGARPEQGVVQQSECVIERVVNRSNLVRRLSTSGKGVVWSAGVSW